LAARVAFHNLAIAPNYGSLNKVYCYCKFREYQFLKCQVTQQTLSEITMTTGAGHLEALYMALHQQNTPHLVFQSTRHLISDKVYYMIFTDENRTLTICQATEHAILVPWGRFSRCLKLSERLRAAVAPRCHQDAVPGGDLILGFGLASLAGYEYLEDQEVRPAHLVGHLVCI
jgi:hypothetical protein